MSLFPVRNYIIATQQFHAQMALLPWIFIGPGLFSSFIIVFTQTVGLLGGVISPIARPLPTHRTT
jgi:hypothetical protein